MPTAWMEVETNSEMLILKKKAVLGPDEDDKTVVTLMTWGEKIREDLRHREILFSKFKSIGTSIKSAATTASKARERLDKERTVFGKATLRASYMSSNRDDAQQVTKETAQFMSESNEEVCSIPNQTHWTSVDNRRTQWYEVELRRWRLFKKLESEAIACETHDGNGVDKRGCNI